MIKKVFIIMLLTMIFIGIFGCVKNDKIPSIRVTIDKEKINCITLKDTANGSSNYKNDIFKFAFEENASVDIKYIKIGSVVILDFGDNPPNKISIKDSLLNANGEHLNPDKLTVEVPYTVENGKYSFTVQKNMASLLSSFYEENKTDFRGYMITSYWDKSEYEHAFVIKADSY
ncbi:hypothetical protein G9F72_010170 [Clostridium estertheticum]|uniref:hypothetical protein n=1 Tax=Clostridium estertheticum TaxID=238834 RepID=UPI0013E93E17|nr:hypothetical protein [Clostridium estertheticum]MBZ9686689.1 hypothetical protein [Clostridium estertheticum]